MKESAIVIDYSTVPIKHRAKEFIIKLPKFFKNYVASIFPILHWIHKYNLTWLVQDIIAGITVGIVVVPQGMAYAKIANLEPQYGLYTSFVGVTLYCFFGTSKDISIGPISTVSLLVGTVVNTVVKDNPSIQPAEVAISLGLITGIIMIIISVLRLGILVDFIPEPAIAGYMTGSAITIVLSQWPKLFGIPDVSTHNSPYLLFGNILAKISHTRLDVAFGLSSLIFLYGVKYLCGRIQFKSKRLQKSVFLFGIMRNGLIVILGTFISFLIGHGKTPSPISVIQSVPAGFDAMGIPKLNMSIVHEAGGVLPSIVLILILEHVSVAKTFGRIYDYQIDPDQEILAIGLSNVVGAFFGGYCATGAFSRTAIMARSGSRTPMAGVFSGAVVVLALYVLTPAFYYIPDAVLAAVVIHAVSDLASSGKYLKELWVSSSVEFFVWIYAVLVTIFVDVQTGIYAAVGLSLLIMLYRFSRPPIKSIVKISVNEAKTMETEKYKCSEDSQNVMLHIDAKDGNHLYVDENDPNFQNYVSHASSNVLIFRPCVSILYPNAEHISDIIVHTVKTKTRCGNEEEMNKKDCERPWNYRKPAVDHGDSLHRLEALVFDFSAVSHVDATALQVLSVTRDTIDKYAGCSVEWHFTNLQNQAVRAALLSAGFGSLDDQMDSCFEQDQPSADSTIASEEDSINKHMRPDLEFYHTPTDKYPCFHWDIQAAFRSIQKRKLIIHGSFAMQKLDTEMTVF